MLSYHRLDQQVTIHAARSKTIRLISPLAPTVCCATRLLSCAHSFYPPAQLFVFLWRSVCGRFAPSPRWQIDTFLTMLSIAGEHVGDSITSDVIHLICHNQPLHA